MKEQVKTRLRTAADAFRNAPDELQEAILEAADDGATNLEIAQEIEFAYSPDYVGKLIRRKRAPRTPGRKPARDNA